MRLRAVVLLGCFQRFEIDIAKLDPQVIALKADVAFFAEDAWMSFRMLLDIFIEVRIDEDVAVLLDGDLPSLRDDFDLVPFADFLVVDFLGDRKSTRLNSSHVALS